MVNLNNAHSDRYVLGGQMFLPQGDLTSVTVTFTPQLSKITPLSVLFKPNLILDSLGLTLYSELFDAALMPPERQNRFYQTTHKLTTPITVTDNMHINITIDQNLSYHTFENGKTGIFMPAIKLEHNINEAIIPIIVEDHQAVFTLADNILSLLPENKDRVLAFKVDLDSASLFKNNTQVNITELEYSNNFYHLSLKGQLDINSNLVTVTNGHFYDLTSDSTTSLFTGHLAGGQKLGIETQLGKPPSYRFSSTATSSDTPINTFDGQSILGLTLPQDKTTKKHLHLTHLSLTQAHPRLAIDQEAQTLTFTPGAIDLQQFNDKLAERGSGENTRNDIDQNKLAIPVLASQVIKNEASIEENAEINTLSLSSNVKNFSLMVNGIGEYYFSEIAHFDDIDAFFVALRNKMTERYPVDVTNADDTNTTSEESVSANVAMPSAPFKYAIKSIIADGNFSENNFTVDTQIKIILDLHNETLQQENYIGLVDNLLAQNDTAKNGLSGGEIAGIVIGSIIAVPSLIAIAGQLVRLITQEKTKQGNNTANSQVPFFNNMTDQIRSSLNTSDFNSYTNEISNTLNNSNDFMDELNAFRKEMSRPVPDDWREQLEKDLGTPSKNALHSLNDANKIKIQTAKTTR